MYLVFQNFDHAQKAADVIWKNYLVECQEKGLKIIDFNGNTVEDLTGHNGFNLAVVPKNGHRSDLTRRYVEIKQSFSSELIHYFEEPPAHLLTGVTDYELSNFEPAWEPIEEI